MRLKLSALLLSTILATGLGAGAVMLSLPVAPVAAAQIAGEVDVDSLLKLLPADKVKATYDSKSYDAITGITTVKSLKFADPKNEGSNYIAIEELGLRGVDVAAFQHVWDFSKYGATRDETFKQLFGDVAVKNASFVLEGKTVAALEALNFGGVQMKQLQHVPPGEQAGTEPRAGNSDEDGLKFAGALLDSVIAGKLDVTNFTYEEDNGKVTLKYADLDGYNRGQFGASSMEGFEQTMPGYSPDSPGSYTKMASGSSDGLDISKVLPWMMKAEMPPVTPEPLLYFGASSVSGLDYDIFGTKVTIAEYAFDAITFYWLVPSSLKFSITDLVYTPPAGDRDLMTGGELKEMGIEKLDIDFGLEWLFDGAAKTARLVELRIEESQLFDIALGLDFVGIDLARLINDQTSSQASMEIGLASGQLVVENNGGFEKFLDVAAKEQSTTPDALKQQALQQLSQLEGGMPGPDGSVKPPTDRVKSIIAAVKAFIESPGSITVKVQPAQPITVGTGMGAMMDPMAAADSLGVTVESTGK